LKFKECSKSTFTLIYPVLFLSMVARIENSRIVNYFVVRLRCSIDLMYIPNTLQRMEIERLINFIQS